MPQSPLPAVVKAALEALRKRKAPIEIATRKPIKETAQTR